MNKFLILTSVYSLYSKMTIKYSIAVTYLPTHAAQPKPNILLNLPCTNKQTEEI